MCRHLFLCLFLCFSLVQRSPVQASGRGLPMTPWRKSRQKWERGLLPSWSPLSQWWLQKNPRGLPPCPQSPAEPRKFCWRARWAANMTWRAPERRLQSGTRPLKDHSCTTSHVKFRHVVHECMNTNIRQSHLQMAALRKCNAAITFTWCNVIT